jgi:glycyl-tRNA synthetase beta chain
LVNESIKLFSDKLINKNTAENVIDFVMGRFRAYYQEKKFNIDVIQAVLAKKPTAPLDFDKRIKAVSYFRDLVEAEALAAANKRVGNILAKFDGELYEIFNDDLAEEGAETLLATVYSDINNTIIPLLAEQDYQAALTELAKLKAPIDNFFDNVMVMSDDEAVKINRLTLLNQIRNSFLAIADISVLQ